MSGDTIRLVSSRDPAAVDRQPYKVVVYDDTGQPCLEVVEGRDEVLHPGPGQLVDTFNVLCSAVELLSGPARDV